MEATPLGGIGVRFEGAPVENHVGRATARFHWNFATKAGQAAVVFQEELKCLWQIGLEGPGAAAA
jgi:hypothetical protein